MPVKDIPLPKYSLSQEIWNSISHGLGALLSLIFGSILIIKSAYTGDVWKIVSSSIFVAGLVLLYTISCIYHSLKRNDGKRVMRVMDHNMVYVLIMATYVPYCLVTLRGYNPWWGWGIITGCFATGIVSIVLNSVNIQKFKVFCNIAYIAMGWCIILSFYPLVQAMGGFYPGPFLLLLGGILYSIGAILYGIGGKGSPWWHTIFHFFVVFASASMFASIYFFVI